MEGENSTKIETPAEPSETSILANMEKMKIEGGLTPKTSLQPADYVDDDSTDWESATSSETETDLSDLEIDIIIQLKITLRGISPPIWRRIQVSSSDTFEELHYYIQDAMGWRLSHAHKFEINDTIIVDNICYDFYKSMGNEKVLKEEEVELREFFRAFGDIVVYEYDHGDGWKHSIKFEKFVLTPGQSDVIYPKCVGGKRACPPEDCGGVPGYQHLIDVYKNPQHEEYEELIEGWLEEFYPGYDPERFNKKKVFKKIVFGLF